MQIREINRQDLISVSKVQVESNRSTYLGIMPKEYLNNMKYECKVNEWSEKLFGKKPTQFMYVAEDEAKKIIGFVSASLSSTHYKYQREVCSIYILKEFQRKGIGKLLIKSIITKFITDGVRTMIIWTLEDNPAKLFYNDLGGQVVDDRIIDRGGKKLRQIAYGWDDITGISF